MENFDDALFHGLGQGERLANMELAKLCGRSCSEYESDQKGLLYPPAWHAGGDLYSPFSTTSGEGVMAWKKLCDDGEATVV